MATKPQELPKALRRTATIERASKRSEGEGEADVALTIAISSEEPVERWFGTEILSHDAGAVDLARAKANGLALLLDHDSREMVGRIQNVRIEDGKIRGEMMFSKSARAQEVRQDVLDGIRTDASIGYQITEWKERKLDGGGVEYTATRWMPLEGSLVAVPADSTVGVGRSANAEPAPSPDPQARTTIEVRMTAPAPAAQAPDDIRSAERQRLSDIETFKRSITEPILRKWMDERTKDWIDKGLDLPTVKIQAYEEMARIHAAGRVTPLEPDLSRKDQESFSVVKAIRTLLDGGAREGLEFEVTAEIEKLQGLPQSKGFRVPWGVLASGYAHKEPKQGKRANELVVGTAGVGGNLRFTDYAGFLEMLRNRVVFFQLGGQYLPGLQGNIQFTKQTAAHTFGWQATEIANQANSAWTLGTVTATPKIGQAASWLSRQLIAQAVESVEGRVRNDIAKIHAIGIDFAALAGPGTGGSPTGISATAGIGDVAGGTNGLAPTYANTLELWSDVAAANAEVAGMKFLTHPFGVARLAQVQRFTSTDTPLWKFAGTPGEGTINELPAMYSNQVPSLQTKGSSTDCYYIYFGDWTAATVCEWGTMEVILDPFSVGPSLIKLASIQMVDVAVTYPAGFSVMKDARP